MLLHNGNGHRLCRDGEVLIENGRVLHAGKSTGIEAWVVNFGSALISPAFVGFDALSDLDTTILGIDHSPGWARVAFGHGPTPNARVRCIPPRTSPFRSAMPSGNCSCPGSLRAPRL
ncbi:hypothetical protein [Thalassorhabdomicrobium marinisediminis]|uniref:hypothetical protein n=1 Tax=Thalassorhabdomicrobium marinisediminis TaxID=2170577 RepID=UPI001304A750|nr:hypothetical protein [Thalassorhabdomicrobium marinisediminis]